MLLWPATTPTTFPPASHPWFGGDFNKRGYQLCRFFPMGGFVSVIPPNNTYSCRLFVEIIASKCEGQKSAHLLLFQQGGWSTNPPTQPQTTPVKTLQFFFLPAQTARHLSFVAPTDGRQGWGPVGGAAGQAAALRQLRHPPGRRAGTVPAAARDATGAAAGCVAAGAAVEAVRPAHDVQGGVHSRHKHKHTHPCTNVDQLPPLFHHHQLCRTKEDNFRVGTVTLCMSLKRRLFPLH